MTTKGFLFIPFRVFLFPTRMSLSMGTVDLCLRKEASDGPHAIVWRLGSLLAPPHQPSALRLTEFDASPPCHRSPRPPPYAPTRSQRLETLEVGTANFSGGGASPARGRRTTPKASAARERSAASARKRPRITPGAKRPARTGGARRQCGGGGAHQAQSGESAPPAWGRPRSAQGAK